MSHSELWAGIHSFRESPETTIELEKGKVIQTPSDSKNYDKLYQRLKRVLCYTDASSRMSQSEKEKQTEKQTK